MEQLTASVKKDAQSTTELAVRSFEGLTKQLNAKMQQIHEAEEEHRAVQDQRVQEYRQLYGRIKPMKQVSCC